MTRIIADTTCGLDPDMARRLGIPLNAQIINFGTESFREGVDMDHAAFMARLKTGRELPKTAAPYPGDFIQAFIEVSQDGESVVCIHPSAEVSGTVRSAEIARSDFPGRDIASSTRGPSPARWRAWCWGSGSAGQSRRVSADEAGAHVRSMMPRLHRPSVDTLQYPPTRRPHRRRTGVTRQHPPDQADPHLHGWAHRPVREGADEEACARSHQGSDPGRGGAWPRRGSDHHAHRRLPEEAAALADDFKAALGTLGDRHYGTGARDRQHAGRGAVGFWFFHAEVRRAIHRILRNGF